MITNLIIQHSPTLKTRYAHLHTILVKEGQFVLRGQTIATTGNTGRSEAPHLHYEVHKNEQEVNPLYYIVDQ
jgi:murein DD-endopeptidase MepM/ murein hydrolase activator NlpD